MRIVKKRGEFTLNEVRKICYFCQRLDDEKFQCPFAYIDIVNCTRVDKAEDEFSQVVEVELNERE